MKIHENFFYSSVLGISNATEKIYFSRVRSMLTYSEHNMSFDLSVFRKLDSLLPELPVGQCGTQEVITILLPGQLSVGNFTISGNFETDTWSKFVVKR